ncbi:hypothetical protein GCM10017744_004580 [Streptomyces antimycoticus]
MGPEPGHRGVRLLLAEQCGGRRIGLREGVGHGLQTNPAVPGARMRPYSAVTGGHDAGPAGPGTGVHDDPAVHLEAEPLGEVGARDGADADEDQVGGESRAVAEEHAGHSAGLPVEPGDGRRQTHHSAPPRMGLPIEFGDDRRDGPLQEPVRGLDDGHLLALCPGGGRHLQADEATPDDHHVAGSGQLLPEPERVVDVAEMMDAAEPGPRNGELAWGGPRGEGDPVIRQLPPRVGDQDTVAGVDDPLAGEEIYPGLGVVLRLPEGESPDVVVTGQQLLGKRWPLIGSPGLLADHRDPFTLPAPPQLQGHLHSGLPSTHDNRSAPHVLVLPPES